MSNAGLLYFYMKGYFKHTPDIKTLLVTFTAVIISLLILILTVNIINYISNLYF